MFVLKDLHKYIVQRKKVVIYRIPPELHVHDCYINTVAQGLSLVRVEYEETNQVISCKRYETEIYTRYRHRPNEITLLTIKLNRATVEVMIYTLNLTFERRGSKLGRLIKSLYHDDDIMTSYDYKTNETETQYYKDIELCCCEYCMRTIVYKNDILIRVEFETTRDYEKKCYCPAYSNTVFIQLDYTISGDLYLISITEHGKDYVSYKKQIPFLFDQMDCS